MKKREETHILKSLEQLMDESLRVESNLITASLHKVLPLTSGISSTGNELNMGRLYLILERGDALEDFTMSLIHTGIRQMKIEIGYGQKRLSRESYICLDFNRNFDDLPINYTSQIVSKLIGLLQEGGYTVYQRDEE